MASLVVWTGSRWRHVSRSGAVSGWRRRARIFCLRDGALRELSFKEAIRRLRRGPALPRIAADSKRKDKHHNVNNSKSPTELKDACMQTEPESEQAAPHAQHRCAFTSHTDTAFLKNPLSNKETDMIFEDKENMNLTNKRMLNNDNMEKQKAPIKTSRNSKHANNESDAPVAVVQSNVHVCDPVQSSSQSGQTSTESETHELVISEECLQLIRNYIEHHNIGIDLYQFDSSEEYQKAVLYRLNPLVVIKRDLKMERLLRSAQAQRFACELGLMPAPVPSRKRVSSQDASVRARKGSSSDSSSAAPDAVAKAAAGALYKTRGEVTTRPLIITQSSVAGGREYSSLEDHAIVSWLSAAGERERAVNGNRVWRELQGQYCAITGVSRTWHSLRNRYLRYILPGLGSLALPQHQVQRLRAKAALGMLKSRRNRQIGRRNSMFAAPAQSSASARVRVARPARAPSASDSDFEDKRVQKKRSTGEPAPAQTPSRRTRSATAARPARREAPARKTRPAAADRDGSSPLSYSDVTRRFALRHRSTPKPSDSSQPDVAGADPDVGASAGATLRPRTRRLYNP